MKSFKQLLIGGSMILSFGAQASVVAIIDSGVDYRHEALFQNQWKNMVEKRGVKGQDDDYNGYVDDIYGWNFAEDNNLVIDYKYLGTFSNDPYKYFDIQLKVFLGTATDAEMRWMKQKREDQEFLQEMMKFGNFVHGTHVAGIAVQGNPEAKELAVKLIPTETNPLGSKFSEFMSKYSANERSDFAGLLISMFLGNMAVQQGDQLEKIGQYINAHKADVANCSFGTGYAQASQIVAALYQTFAGREPTEEEVYEISVDFLNKVIEESKRFINAAPNTLFVMAAGNDGTNNQRYPTSPTNIKANNTISVAAMLNRGNIASFSNYSNVMVEVAALGVGIESAIPGDEYLRVSGTSQAAPAVANIAARIKDANEYLTPGMIKKIIMETVDKKAALRNKVKAGGVVNLPRAVRAGELSATVALHMAIEQAHNEVADIEEDRTLLPFVEAVDAPVLPLPSLFNL